MAEAEKKGAPKEEKKEPKRSNFATLYPEDAKVKLNVKENPKKEGSKAHERFAFYTNSKTVGDYRAAGGTYQDIAYDIGRGFISVG